MKIYIYIYIHIYECMYRRVSIEPEFSPISAMAWNVLNARLWKGIYIQFTFCLIWDSSFDLWTKIAWVRNLAMLDESKLPFDSMPCPHDCAHYKSIKKGVLKEVSTLLRQQMSGSPIIRFMSNTLPLELSRPHICHHAIWNTGHDGVDGFVCIVNVWNINWAQAVAYSHSKRGDVL